MASVFQRKIKNRKEFLNGFTDEPVSPRRWSRVEDRLADSTFTQLGADK